MKKSRFIMCLALSATLLVMLTIPFYPSSAEASQWSGIDLQAGKYSLRVTFSLGYYRPGDLDYIMDPSGLLFDLITLFQKNYPALAEKDMDVWIDILGYNEEEDWKDPQNYCYISIQVIQGEQDCKAHADCYNGVTWLIPFKRLSRELLERQICATLPALDCALGSEALGSKTFIYLTDNEELVDNDEMIEFGALPGSRRLPYPFLRPLEGREEDFRKVTVKRAEMQKYFDPLDAEVLRSNF